MTWFKMDDNFGDHPKVIRAGNEAVGLFTRCGTWSSKHLSDGFVPEDVVLMYGSKRLAQKLVDARLFEPPTVAEDGQRGYVIHDFLVYNPSRNEVESERARRNELRDPELVAAVKERDGNRCRYCGCDVKWTDRRGDSGGTLDHVVPGEAGGLGNLVVACRGCNGAKKNRTPTEAGMALLPPPGSESGPRSDLDQTQVGPVLGLVPDPVPEADAPGRVGSGRVGTDQVGPVRSGSGRRRNRDRLSPRRPADGGTVARPPRTVTGRCPDHHVDEPCRMPHPERPTA